MNYRLALIGHPVGHSLSQHYFQQKFTTQHIDGNYTLIDLENLDTLRQIVEQQQLTGFNVTAPHKQTILTLCDSLSTEADTVKAVNTVKIENGKLIGHNTDIEGFATALQQLLKPHHTQALVLGNGGASKAVCYALKNRLNIPYTIVSRNGEGINYADVNEQTLLAHTIIVNCTTLGMVPNTNTFPQLPYQHITNKHLLFDLIYAPETTQFLRFGQLRGATTSNGLTMLYAQAEAAWRFWQH
ncbi:MAG: shikimate dehydrogenase [Bacteroidales bacterium]|nr:shikimate dehydrogenase [Bacteroidales bacterium]